MRVVFRTDASDLIGTGHVMRCLTLADRLRRKGASVQFVCRDHPGHLCEWIQERGFSVFRLPFSLQSEFHAEDPYERWLGETWEIDANQTADCFKNRSDPIDMLIVDHYSIDIKWEQRLRIIAKKIMVVDDLANRAHDCDILLDQNLYDHMEKRYQGKVPESCIQLLGPRYALLRDEFYGARTHAKVRDGAVQRIFIFFGGNDATNETEKALEAIRLLNRPEIIIDVVVGRSNTRKEQIDVLCSKIPSVNYYCQIDFMAKLMLKADLAIGAGGSTTWERCSLGLPAITVTTADNQLEVAEAVSRAGAILYLGHFDRISPETILKAVVQFSESPDSIASMSKAAMALLGGLHPEEKTDAAEVLFEMM